MNAKARTRWSNYVINMERIPFYRSTVRYGIFHLGSFPESSDHNVCLPLIRVNGKDCWKHLRRLSLFFVLEQRRAEITLGPIAKQRDLFAGRPEFTCDS